MLELLERSEQTTLLLFSSHEAEKIDDSVAVSELVVVPGDELDEVVVQRDSCAGVENAASAVAVEVARDHFVFGVAENAFERTCGRIFDGRFDRFVGSGFAEPDSEVDDRHVRRWNAERHSRQLSVQLRYDLADRFRGAGGRRDDVLGGAAAVAPRLAAGTVDGFLRRRVRMDSGHEAFDDAELVVDDLRQGCEAVGRARSVADHLHRLLVLLLVDAHDEHRGVRGWGRDHDVLGASFQVGACFFHGRENASRLDYVLSAVSAPRNLRRVALGVYADCVAVDVKFAAFCLDLALEHAMG